MPGNFVDFREVKARVKISDVLARYGFLAELREKKPGKLVGACPIHGGKNGNSFSVDTEKNIFNCFSQCGGGNVLDLVGKLEGCSIRDAALKLAEWFLSVPARDAANRTQESPKAAIEKKEEHDPIINPPLDHELKTLDYKHPYLAERGLTDETIRTFGVGFCSRGLMKNRVAIPLHNEKDELVAYAGRAVDDELAREEGKYRLPTNFMKSHVLYNLNRAREHGFEKGIIVVEGFFDAMKVHQAGFPNVVALMGSTLSEYQEALLIKVTDRLSLMFDGDDAGEKCLREFYGKLRRRMYLKEIHLEEGEQPDSMSDERIRSLLS